MPEPAAATSTVGWPARSRTACCSADGAGADCAVDPVTTVIRAAPAQPGVTTTIVAAAHRPWRDPAVVDRGRRLGREPHELVEELRPFVRADDIVAAVAHAAVAEPLDGGPRGGWSGGPGTAW